MARLWTNNAAATLSGAHNNTQTSIYLASGKGALFPSPTGGDYFMLTLTQAGTESSYEIVKCTARTTDTLTVVRAQEGTTGQSWVNGDKAELRVTADAFTSIPTMTETLQNKTLNTTNCALGTLTGLLKVTSGAMSAASSASDYQAFITAGTTSQYWRGDKTWQTLDKSAVGLANVENTTLSTWAGTSNITTVGTIGTGTWNATAIADSKIASALTGKTYNGLTLTAAATGFTIAGGTTSKTLTISNTLTLQGTDSSTLNIGGGGTLGSAAYTNSTAYEAAITAGTTAQYWRGDKSWQTLDKSAVGLSNVENTAISTWAGSANITTVGTIGTGTWNATAIADGKIASALTGKTYNGLTLTAAATGFTIAGGTTSKTLTISNTLTLSGTDSSTLNIGSGGTLGSAAYTASTAYAPATSGTSILKGNGSGGFSNATAGTDYLAPPSGTALLKANSGGALANATAGTDYISPTGTESMSNKTLTAPTITNYTETLYAPSAGSSFTVDLANGTVQKFTTNANTTITLPSSVAGKSYTLLIAFGGAHTLTWAGGSTLKWHNGTEPTETSVNAKFDIYSFICDGTNTYGIQGGANF